MLMEHFGTALAVEGLAVENPTQIAPLDGLISVSQIIKQISFVTEGRTTTLAVNTM